MPNDPAYNICEI